MRSRATTKQTLHLKRNSTHSHHSSSVKHTVETKDAVKASSFKSQTSDNSEVLEAPSDDEEPKVLLTDKYIIEDELAGLDTEMFEEAGQDDSDNENIDEFKYTMNVTLVS